MAIMTKDFKGILWDGRKPVPMLSDMVLILTKDEIVTTLSIQAGNIMFSAPIKEFEKELGDILIGEE